MKDDSGVSVFSFVSDANGRSPSSVSGYVTGTSIYGTGVADVEVEHDPNPYTIEVQASGKKTLTIEDFTLDAPITPAMVVNMTPIQQHVIGKGKIQAQGSTNQWIPLGW